MLRANRYAEVDRPQDHAPTGKEDQSPDILKVLWRWKWLACAGAMLGGIAGFLQFSRQEPTYQSSALIQVVYPSAEAAGFESLEGPNSIGGQSRLDESLIIKSAKVIDEAIRIGKLERLPRFKGQSVGEIRAWILAPRRLVVEPAGRDSSTALIDVKFVSVDEELSKQVVDSVIAGYDSYLEEAYRSLGNEVVKVVTQAQDKLRESYESLATKHAEFRKNAPMIWVGDEARNQFAENSVEVNNSINQIEIESKKIQATLQHIGEVQRQGRSADAILLMLSSDPTWGESLLLGDNDRSATEGVDTKASEALPFSSAQRRAVLMELQMKEQELLDTVGEGHPSVATIRRRIELLDSQITTLADSERQLEAKQMEEFGKIEVTELTADEKLELWKGSLEERLVALGKQRESLTVLAADNEVKSKEVQEYLTQNTLLNSELTSVQQLLDGYTNTLNRIQILPESSRRTLETLTPAATGEFYGPSLMPYLLGGSAVGFLFIAGLGLLVDWLDQSYRDPGEITQALGHSVLGHVPLMPIAGGRTKPVVGELDDSLCTVNGGSREASEAYRSVRTGLYFSETGDNNRVIQVTSPAPGDGKSTLAANLAISIAQSGRSVLLVDADLRRPRVAQIFGHTETMGIGDVIMGAVDLDDAISPTQIKGLSLLANPRPSTHPSEIVSHSSFQKILDSVRESFDYVIVDTPPVLAVADACAVAARVDGVILTLRLRRDSKTTSTEASKQLSAVGARVLGVVINGVSGHDGYSYSYRSYGYESDNLVDSRKPDRVVYASSDSNGEVTRNLTHSS